MVDYKSYKPKMTVDNAVMILEDVIAILTLNGFDNFYLSQISDAVDTLIAALPEDTRKQIIHSKIEYYQ